MHRAVASAAAYVSKHMLCCMAALTCTEQTEHPSCSKMRVGHLFKHLSKAYVLLKAAQPTRCYHAGTSGTLWCGKINPYGHFGPAQDSWVSQGLPAGEWRACNRLLCSQDCLRAASRCLHEYMLLLIASSFVMIGRYNGPWFISLTELFVRHAHLSHSILPDYPVMTSCRSLLRLEGDYL